MKKLEPIIVDQDQLMIDEMNEGIDTAIPVLQQAWDAYSESAFFDQSTTLETLIQSPELLKQTYKLELVKEMHPTPENSVLELDATEEAKKWKLPTPQLDMALAQVNDAFEGNRINISFFTVKSDQIIVREDTVQNYISRYIDVAETEWEILLVKKSQKFTAAMTDLDAHLKKARVDVTFLNERHPLQIHKWFVKKEDKYSLNPQRFRSLKSAMARRDFRKEVEK